MGNDRRAWVMAQSGCRINTFWSPLSCYETADMRCRTNANGSFQQQNGTPLSSHTTPGRIPPTFRCSNLIVIKVARPSVPGKASFEPSTYRYLYPEYLFRHCDREGYHVRARRIPYSSRKDIQLLNIFFKQQDPPRKDYDNCLLYACITRNLVYG
jgi:hypothetical protein